MMITGSVNAVLEATVRLRVRGPQGPEQEVPALIDTGFNGYLTLPPSTITSLGLQRVATGRAVLANGAEEVFDTYEAIVIWEGQPRLVEIASANTDPLVGMALLEGQELRVQVWPGGTVTVEAPP